MGLETLQYDSLLKIAETARDKYVHLDDETPGKDMCGRTAVDMAYELYLGLGDKNFKKYVSCARIIVTNGGGGHSVLVVGGRKPEFKQTFELGLKLDPTIVQFQHLHPELKELNGKCVFDGDYPMIHDGRIFQDALFPVHFLNKIVSKSKNFIRV